VFDFSNGNFVEDSSVTIRARLVDQDGELLAAADVAAIVYSVFDLTLGTVVSGHSGAAVTPADVLVAATTSVEDPLWTGQASYNFKHTISGSAFPLGGRQYQIEYTVTPVAGEAIQTMPIKINVTERRNG